MAKLPHTRDNKVDYCTSTGTTIKAGADGEGEIEVTHQCRYPADHPLTTPHSCWLCSTTWDEEASC